MSRSLNVYRSTNDLAYSELPQPKHGDLKTFDEDRVKKENALEFYRFELAFLQVSGAQDQLQTHAATQENFVKDGKPTENLDDPVWTQIKDGVNNEITQVGSKIPDVDTMEFSEQEVIDDPVTKVSRYTDSMARTGLTDQSFSTSLLPSSTTEWIAEVARKTRLNTLIGGWIRRMFSPPSAEPTVDTDNLRQTVISDALYGLLAAQVCREEGHGALLQLSGWDEYLEGRNVFQMFLSCSPGISWQRVTCLFESSVPEERRGPQVADICFKISTARFREVPLLFSFNGDRLWTTTGPREFLTEHETNPNPVDLETLLTQGCLKTSDLQDSIRKFRFAHRLASSLYSLYSGPWVQHDWSSESVHIIPNRNGRPVEMLDEAYVTCAFNTNGRQIHTSYLPFQNTNSTETCPRFFLSLAQLLVDIANGERSHRSSSQDDFRSWYSLLVAEVRRNMNDQLMGSYWRAIQGCLLYLENYENHGQGSLDEKLRAREVIYEHVVYHLQENLNFWREQQEARSVEEAENGSETSQPHGHARRIVDQQHIEHGLLATATSPRPRAGPTVETKFTLWSNHDDNYTIIPRPTTGPSNSSFISYMQTFRATYIEPLPEPMGNEDGLDTVCVAIIDTGLYIEERDLDGDGDEFLAHPDVQSRVKDRRNFFSPDDTEPDPDDCEDKHGHGTHVARLVLRFAPRAHVVIAKITNSKTLKSTKTAQLVNALKWAGERADIINLSFSLGSMHEPELAQVIRDLISNNKLIFVAASNTGGYGSRLWPASCFGVFAIHATNEFGTPDTNMNPPPLPTKDDNFATYGCNVESYWKGHYRSISGTSFATPVAAAVCANILEYARRTQDKTVVNGLTRYSAMRALFRDHMTLNNLNGHYHCFHLWTKGLWDGDKNRDGILDVLWKASR